jgi:hypothetical protein
LQNQKEKDDKVGEIVTLQMKRHNNPSSEEEEKARHKVLTFSCVGSDHEGKKGSGKNGELHGDDAEFTIIDGFDENEFMRVVFWLMLVERSKKYDRVLERLFLSSKNENSTVARWWWCAVGKGHSLVI